jgi:hypothetical protein
MDIKQFKENLLIYGAELDRWPEEIRKAGLESVKESTELRNLLTDQDRFESFLRTRKYEEPSNHLAQQIISTALRQHQAQPSLSAFFSELFSAFSMPKMVLTTVSILLIGFIIGYSNPIETVSVEQEQTNLEAFLYDEGDGL